MNHNHLVAGSIPATATSVVVIWLLAVTAVGCGNDGVYHGGVHVGASLPAQIANVRFSPTTFMKGEGGDTALITGSLDFCDLDGDVVLIRTITQDPKTKRTDLVSEHNVRGLATPLTGSAEFCTKATELPGEARDSIIAKSIPFIGTFPFSLRISTTLTGDRQFLIMAENASEQTSNVVSGRFSVSPAP